MNQNELLFVFTMFLASLLLAALATYAHFKMIGEKRDPKIKEELSNNLIFEVIYDKFETVRNKINAVATYYGIKSEVLVKRFICKGLETYYPQPAKTQNLKTRKINLCELSTNTN